MMLVKWELVRDGGGVKVLDTISEAGQRRNARVGFGECIEHKKRFNDLMRRFMTARAESTTVTLELIRRTKRSLEGMRCGVVYYGAPGGRFACRHCVRVGYLSQCEDETERLWRRQRKLERKLVGGVGEWNGWLKPKGIRQRTFDRLRGQIWELEMQKDELFEAQAASLLRRLGVSL